MTSQYHMIENARRMLRYGVPVVVAVLSACSSLTDVEAPDVTQPSAFANANGALVLRAGALSTFNQGVAQQALFTGLLTDEFADRNFGSLTADTRIVSESNNGRYPYSAFSTARISALTAIQNLEQYNPTPAWRIGELFAVLGYIETFFAEDMCSGIPLGTVVAGQPVYGATASRADLLKLALEHFDSAAAHSTANDSIVNFIRIGKGRALLASGDFAGAAAAVAGVPLTYEYAVTFGPNATATNTVFSNVGQLHSATVADMEGMNGLPFVSANDARVPTLDVGPGLSGGEVFNFQHYTSLTSPIPLATGIEAVLITAEDALDRGDIPTWTSLLNSLRQTAISSPILPLTADSTTTASAVLRENVMFRERAFWLFGTGHRQGDMRRLVRQYGRDVESVFPTGPYPSGGTMYGHDVTFVPSGEQFNTAYSGCIDRNP